MHNVFHLRDISRFYRRLETCLSIGDSPGVLEKNSNHLMDVMIRATLGATQPASRCGNCVCKVDCSIPYAQLTTLEALQINVGPLKELWMPIG